MRKRKKDKYINEDRYVAEVTVGLLEEETNRLNDIKYPLHQGDQKSAAKHWQIYELHRVANQ
jgi:uncharacterized protein YciU (UPF0263 family)